MRRWGGGQASAGGGARRGGQPEGGPESRVRGGRKQEPRNGRGTETPSVRLQVMGE